MVAEKISTSDATNLMQKIDFSEKRRTLQNTKNLFSHIKMDKEILTFGNIKIEKKNLYHLKALFF